MDKAQWLIAGWLKLLLLTYGTVNVLFEITARTTVFDFLHRRMSDVVIQGALDHFWVLGAVSCCAMEPKIDMLVNAIDPSEYAKPLMCSSLYSRVQKVVFA